MVAIYRPALDGQALALYKRWIRGGIGTGRCFEPVRHGHIIKGVNEHAYLYFNWRNPNGQHDALFPLHKPELPRAFAVWYAYQARATKHMLAW